MRKPRVIEREEELKRVDELVFQFQAGNEEAGDTLLRLFGCHPDQGEMKSYLGKYYKLIRYGKINFKDKDTRRFIALFVKDKSEREALVPWYQYAQTKKTARKKMEDISSELREMENDDLKQMMREVFLSMVVRYQKKQERVYFPGYLYNGYGKNLKNQINSYIRKNSPIVKDRKTDTVVREYTIIHGADDVLLDELAIIELSNGAVIDTPRIQEDDMLGNSWVRGLTCGEEFTQLTSLERLILKLHEEDKMKDADIGKKLNMHLNTVYRKRTRACESVRQKVAELIKEGYYL